MDTSPAPHSGEELASPLVERVAAVVALKTLPAAKSRFSSLPDRSASGWPGAWRSTPSPRSVLRCTRSWWSATSPTSARPCGAGTSTSASSPNPTPVRGHPAPATDLNAALARADKLLRAEGVAAVLACVGDLPALRSTTVRRLITASRGRPRSLVSDHEGQGTTMLIARGVPLDPLYGTETVAGDASVRLPVTDGRERSTCRSARCRTPAVTWTRRPISPSPPVSGSVRRPPTARPDHRRAGRSTTGGGAVGRPDQAHRAGRRRRHRGGDVPVSLSTYDGDPALLVPGRRLHAVRVADDLRCWT